MKRYQMIGLAGTVWGCSILPAAAWVGGGASVSTAAAHAAAVRGPDAAAAVLYRPGSNARIFRSDGGRGCFNRGNFNNFGSFNKIGRFDKRDFFGNRGDFGGRDFRHNGFRCEDNGGGYSPMYPVSALQGWAYGPPSWWNNYPPYNNDYGNYGMATAVNDMPPDYGMANVPPDQTGAVTDVVVLVQRELRRRGYYRGVVNGISDGSTRAAIRAFEANMGLPVTGVIGLPLLRTLGFF